MTETTTQRLRQREYLLQISRAITAQLDLTSVLNLVITFAVEILAGNAGLIALHEEEDGSGPLRIRASAGVPPEVLPAFSQLLNLNLQETSTRTVAAVLREIASDTSLTLRQVIALPLTLRDAPVGTIYVFRAAVNVSFSMDEAQLLQAFADQAAIGVSNARLYQSVLREKQRLDAMIEQSADGVMIVDHRWRITTFNRAMEQLTGWPRSEAIGRPCAEVLAIQDVNDNNICLVDCPLQRRPLDENPIVEGRIMSRDGRERYIQSRYAPQRSPNGAFLGAIANVRDITDQKKDEESQITFVSVVSHELKTPVSIIKGYANLMSREDAEWNPQVIRDGLHVIEEEADRLTRQIQDLLDVSRLQAGGLRIDKTDWSLTDMAQSVAQAFATQTDDRFEFQLRFSEDFLPVHADYERIRMVLTNLVSNAVKYSPEGGIIRIGGTAQADYVIVYVSDQGVGIPPEEQERIFDRFYRVDNRLKRDTQGAGLGLFLTRAIIEAHGGTIHVESQLGRGSRFIFTLQAARRQLESEVV
ncbi:MAG: PAS domain S-box protein [Chloroflexaceae bacterium]|nr:PAS domain S-box protein [Chloroflexaceae bacterium]NJL34973.1 PAS domain S-box protein [Chloroflexaceae bacterium]NJO05240.1 PAS domain S-box protein [Chloroflexaceae bacterium]